MTCEMCRRVLTVQMIRGMRYRRITSEELGDVLWYCAELAAGLNMGLDDVAAANIAKLRARYPDGFDPERSRNRDV